MFYINIVLLDIIKFINNKKVYCRNEKKNYEKKDFIEKLIYFLVELTILIHYFYTWKL